MFAYNHVMEVPETLRDGTGSVAASSRYRLYYDCIEGTGLPPGQRLQSTSARRICLATSDDGLNWDKPELEIFNRNSTKGWSKANNILLEDSGVSVFIDRSPEAVASGKPWKMVCSQSAYESSDGILWTRLPFKQVATDDTKPTAYWDSHLQKYVISVRRDLDPDWFRTIGRCVSANLSDWQSELAPGASGCPVVFSLDELDPICHNKTDCTGGAPLARSRETQHAQAYEPSLHARRAAGMDIYTNAWTPYPSAESPSVHLFFPSMYYHFGKFPYGFGNDGLLDIRLVVSRDGENLHYVGPRVANKGRSPFVPLGINKCGAAASSPDGYWGGAQLGIEPRARATLFRHLAPHPSQVGLLCARLCRRPPTGLATPAACLDVILDVLTTWQAGALPPRGSSRRTGSTPRPCTW